MFKFVQQAEPIKKLLDDLKIQNSLMLGETTSAAFEKKNIANLTFLQGCLKHLFLADKQGLLAIIRLLII